MDNAEHLVIRELGQREYLPVWQAMTDFTENRDRAARDEIWLVEHLPVFTQGQAGKAEHVLAAGDIPVVQVDRGGQVTYHGPGQQVIYLLLDVRRLKVGVRNLVTIIEESIIATLKQWGIDSAARADAPGVYVGDAKIAALGLRIRKGCSFHGLSLNVDMDLEPFNRINPCGYAGMPVTQVADLADKPAAIKDIRLALAEELARRLGYNDKSGYTICSDWTP